jgi:hypothetical protein
MAAGLLLCAAPAAAEEKVNRICVDLRIGQESFYDCLNAQLRSFVPDWQSRQAVPGPLYAAAPANVVGGFTVAGTRQMLGANFGRSVHPQRP